MMNEPPRIYFGAVLFGGAAAGIAFRSRQKLPRGGRKHPDRSALRGGLFL